MSDYRTVTGVVRFFENPIVSLLAGQLCGAAVTYAFGRYFANRQPQLAGARAGSVPVQIINSWSVYTTSTSSAEVSDDSSWFPWLVVVVLLGGVLTYHPRWVEGTVLFVSGLSGMALWRVRRVVGRIYDTSWAERLCACLAIIWLVASILEVVAICIWQQDRHSHSNGYAPIELVGGLLAFSLVALGLLWFLTWIGAHLAFDTARSTLAKRLLLKYIHSQSRMWRGSATVVGGLAFLGIALAFTLRVPL